MREMSLSSYVFSDMNCRKYSLLCFAKLGAVCWAQLLMKDSYSAAWMTETKISVSIDNRQTQEDGICNLLVLTTKSSVNKISLLHSLHHCKSMWRAPKFHMWHFTCCLSELEFPSLLSRWLTPSSICNKLEDKEMCACRASCTGIHTCILSKSREEIAPN